MRMRTWIASVAVLASAVALPGGSAMAGPNPRDKVIAETVVAQCRFSPKSQAVIPQTIRVTLTAADVLRSMERYVTCSETISTVNTIVAKRRGRDRVTINGFRCVSTPVDPDGFTVRYVCNLRSKTVTTVRLEFDLILD